MSLSRVVVASPVGRWVVEGDADGLTRLYLPKEKVSLTEGVVPTSVRRAATQLEQYFRRDRQNFEVDLHSVGTEFQQAVWLELAAIPYGQVRSYGEVAASVGRPNAYRAVGNANGKNPWPIFIPCHRVVAATGVGGYAGGLNVKRFLLELEGVSTYS